MIDNKKWIEKQQTKEEIKDNYALLQKVKAGLHKPDENFELVVDRLFMAIDRFEKIQAHIILDENMKPVSCAPGSSPESKGRDCYVSYVDLDLVVEITRRPLAHTAHWDHLDENPKNEQQGIIVFLDIRKVDKNIWIQNKVILDDKEKFFHLCDADFLFQLLKDQPTAFTEFKKFLLASEKIWREEEDFGVIEKKIINLIKKK
tara:strand:+ start:800 stop:1408 length:609 start_codon:yes stop_codon:yes gene_type:complete